MDDKYDLNLSYEEYRKYAIDHTVVEGPGFDAEDYECQYPDLIYETEDSGKNYHNRLDLYLPFEDAANKPLLIYIHGGAFTMGTKRHSIRPLVMRDHGYAVAMVEYTKATEAVFPTQIRQVKQAIAFLRENADQYGIDAGRFAIYGESAGGNLAALAGVSGNKELFGLTSQRDYSVQAVITDFAPINFAAVNEQLEMLGMPIPTDLMSAGYYSSLYLGGFMHEHPELIPPTNPETYIHEQCPPFYIQHGMKHQLPYLQAEHFAQELVNKIGKDKVYLSLLPEVGGGEDPGYFTEENTMAKITFLNKVFHQYQKKGEAG